jgi:hypothetical protein
MHFFLWTVWYSFVLFPFARLSYNDKKILYIGSGNKSYENEKNAPMKTSEVYLRMTASDTLYS